MSFYNILRKKIKTNRATICVIGLGYVGSAIIEKFDKRGFKTIGVDSDKTKLVANNNSRKMKLTNEYKYVNLADVIILALPTPLKKNMKLKDF